MGKEFTLSIPPGKIPAATAELTLEILAFQNVIVEMLLPGSKIDTPAVVNEKLNYHRARIWNDIYSEYGETPTVDNEENK